MLQELLEEDGTKLPEGDGDVLLKELEDGDVRLLSDDWLEELLKFKPLELDLFEEELSSGLLLEEIGLGLPADEFGSRLLLEGIIDGLLLEEIRLGLPTDEFGNKLLEGILD